MARIVSMTAVVAVAAAAGFAAGHELQREARLTEARPGDVTATETVPAPIAPVLLSLREPESQAEPAIPAVPETDGSASLPTTSNPESTTAYESIALLISEQVSVGTRTADQQMKIAVAAQKLTPLHRQQLMEQYVGAQNRGELGTTEPPPF